MSFLNSVLSAINDGSTQVVTPTVRTHMNSSQTTVTRPNAEAIPQRYQSPTTKNNSVLGKRKAETDLSGLPGKAQKRDAFSAKSSSGSGASDRATVTAKPILKVTSAPSGANQGPNKPGPITPISAEAKAPPKKGSFAEIMARGKPTIPPVGIIMHKPKEKLSSKKELELLKRERALKIKSGSKISKSAPGSQRSSPAPSKQKEPGGPQGKSVKTTGYRGTAKGKPQTFYKGTMKPITPPPPSTHKRAYDSDAPRVPKPKSVARQKERYSEEESGADDGESYMEDEDYSDMEAGFEDVEEEDEKAARLAKKEDDFEKMMLDELKRQKEAKRQRLLAEKARRR
ncbi:hypothetical protein MMC34_006951 [Xylographa carneopallida]|nr:hypothetical protein [Xylographa carneopallida]